MTRSDSVITGLDRITYGIADLPEGRRFFSDWGLRLVHDDADRVVFETAESAQIVLRQMDAKDLPPAIEEGPTVREVVWGVDTAAQLKYLAERLEAATTVEGWTDGRLQCRDPVGLSLGFQMTNRRRARVVGAATNAYGRISRVNEPSPLYERAHPVRLSHIVLSTNAIEEHVAFYRDVLGFHLSDSYPGDGYFLRCQAEGGHHDLFLLRNASEGPALNHVSFMVRDIYEVFGGGLHMSRCGWQTAVGPGRHPISSAIFWYMKSPCGALVEYYADEDYVTAEWQPRELERSAENFAEWAITGGIDSTTRKQKKI